MSDTQKYGDEAAETSKDGLSKILEAAKATDQNISTSDAAGKAESKTKGPGKTPPVGEKDAPTDKTKGR